MHNDAAVDDLLGRRGAAPGSTGSNGKSISSHDRIAVGVFALGLSALLLPLLVAAAVLIAAGVPEIPLQADRALIEIQTRATLSGEPPLVGPYSRFGFSHPGPLLFYLYAVFYKASGGDAGSLPLAALSLNAVGLIGLNLIVRHAAGLRAAAWTAPLCVVWLSFSGGALLEIWNPYASIVPFLLACVAMAAFAGGSTAALAVAAAAGTLAVQSHVGYAPSLLGALAVVVILRLRPAASARAGSEPRRVMRWVLIGAVASLAAWVPPILEQLTGEPGNATMLLEFLAAHPARHTWGDTILRAPMVLAAFPFGWWLSAGSGMAAVLLLVQLCLVGLATRWALRNHRAFQASLGILTLVLHLTVIVSMHAIVGPIESYLIHWMTGVGFLSWLVIGSVAVELPAPSVRPVGRYAAVAVIAVIGVLCASLATRDLAAEARSLMTGQPADAAWRDVSESCLRAGLDNDWSGWVVRYVDDDSWYRLPELVNRLRKGGLEVVVDPEQRRQYPLSYWPTEPAGGTLLVGARELLDLMPGNGTGLTIGYADRVGLRAERFGTPLEGTYPFALLPAFSPRFAGFTPTKRIGSESYRWSDGGESRMLIPLRQGMAHRIAVDVMPYAAPGASQVLTISADRRDLAVIPLRMEKVWQRLEVDLPADRERQWREVRFAYASTHERLDVAFTADFTRLGVAFRSMTVTSLSAQ